MFLISVFLMVCSKAVATHPVSKFCVVGDERGELVAYSLQRGTFLHAYEAHLSKVQSIAFLPSEPYLFGSRILSL